METILTHLQELDHLYHEDTLDEYEKQCQATARLVRQTLPGFIIAYAELYNSGIFRLSDAAISHVLVPIPEQREISHPSSASYV